MTKGRKRSNRELKKPKQTKPKSAATAVSAIALVLMALFGNHQGNVEVVWLVGIALGIIAIEFPSAYAAKNAHRHMLICDSHVPSGGLLRDGKLLMDFHSFPLRIKEIPGKPEEAELKVGTRTRSTAGARAG